MRINGTIWGDGISSLSNGAYATSSSLLAGGGGWDHFLSKAQSAEFGL